MLIVNSRIATKKINVKNIVKEMTLDLNGTLENTYWHKTYSYNREIE